MRGIVAAEKIPAGATVSDGHDRFTINTVDVHTPVRNNGEFARPAIGKLWWRSKAGQTWIVEVGSEWLVV